MADPTGSITPEGSPEGSTERIIQTDLRSEMSRSYLEYAMSVIVGRALPDARDGLKPVHRRILYAMYELGLTSDRPYRKCARVVGEVLGKYHPHGDTAVYDALVRMAQSFSMRAPLIDGHGNFGSVDNDPPAAMRYTESRLQSLTTDSLLEDIEAETVDFIDNFDGSQQEPTVMPARLPHLLLNGSSGIAVGMATNIPPHNLGELIDGVLALIANPELDDRSLMSIIPGPDFPTGGQILGRQGIRETYSGGRGSITMRGVAAIETLEVKGRPDRDAVIITELPYQTNKAALIERIAELVNDKKLEGISDIRDESDRDGMRIVIELRRDAYPQVVLNNLYKITPLQNNFSAYMLALVKGEPLVLNLRRMLQVFIEFRIETIERRTRYLLRKAEERDHILLGLLVALNDLDAIIKLIRGAADAATARQELTAQHGLTDIQADAILQMQLRRLTALEADKIRLEHEDLLAKIANYKNILENRERVLEIIETELKQLKEKHSTPRRTEILDLEGGLEDIDLIANERSVVLLTENGYLKRMPVSEFESTSRGTRGKAGTKSQGEEAVCLFISCNDHDSLLLFSDRGVVYSVPAYRVPIASRAAKGTPIVQLLPIPREEKITSILAVSAFEEEVQLLMLTSGGYIKRTLLSAFSNIRANGLIAIGLEPSDALRWVRLAKVGDSVLIGSLKGMAIHFRISDDELRPLGRSARGVRAMALRAGDSLMSMDVLPKDLADRIANSNLEIADAAADADADVDVPTTSEGPWVLVATASGLGKRVPVDQFRLQKRAGMGLRGIKFRRDGDTLVGLRVMGEEEELLLVSERGVIVRLQSDAIPQQSRAATGVRLQKLDSGDRLAEVVLVPPALELEEEVGAEAEA
ncbi:MULTISPECIES: DNA gyrase subunit A [Synechococcus]|jgi:DNA gyrase subunit A|uniref:DNA gyrase subunit A n=1 Tax=Synechococcus lacustris str. Tous TaxID=1910958 RepID=A0A2P7EC73_9SYNE|nr:MULTISPECIES: DNA gyrase subunit A [Synechococcus]MCF8134629.1 DNA gyrase subunit A [Synechococcus lacustris]HBU26154.1 DNA gyrase subunit A [Synechococcales bacterium UBA8138]MCP9811612.1 DNA gyrase subunit A [Synechococcus lacustris Maggiore-St4-Slac]MCP9921708.1 DNA gyrase subunit A [Synechococcus lacustris Cruz CV12-2]MCP9924565.1 DNA gyrase subunit A [Synechococcus lacustris C3-12m-Tous]